MVGLQVVVAPAEQHEVVELCRSALFDRDDVIALEPVADATTRHLAEAVSCPKGAVDVAGDPSADMCDVEDVDTLFDHDLHERGPEEVLDRREWDWADAFDLADLARLELATAQCLRAHVQDDLCPWGTRAGAGGRSFGPRTVSLWVRTRAGARRLLARAAERDEGVCHVGLVRLTAPFSVRLFEDPPLLCLEGVLHDRTLDWWELTTNADCSLVCHPDTQMAPRPQACIFFDHVLFGRLGGDDACALLAQIVQGVSLCCREQGLCC